MGYRQPITALRFGAKAKDVSPPEQLHLYGDSSLGQFRIVNGCTDEHAEIHHVELFLKK